MQQLPGRAGLDAMRHGHKRMAQAWRSFKTGDLSRADRLCLAIVERYPEHVDALNLMSHMACMRGNFDRAAQLTQRLIAIEPRRAVHHSNLGYILNQQRQPEAALAAIEKAVVLDRCHADAYLNRAVALAALGGIEQAIADCRTAQALNPASLQARTNLLAFLNCSDACSETEIFNAHVAFGRACRSDNAAMVDTAPWLPRKPGERIRIGYLSPDLRTHSVAYFVTPVFQNHDRQAFELFAYYNNRQHDATSDTLRQCVDHWTVTSGLNDVRLAEQVRADGIDILVDLAGHTANSRLLACLQRMAPVQMNWLGYPNTTGLPGIDYRLCDRTTDPAGVADRLHSETLVRMRECFLCYQPPTDAPPVAVPPHAERGYITFGSFNSRSKITATTLRLWARVLAAVPNSKLFLKNAALSGTVARQALRQQCLQSGIAPGRLILRGRDSTRDAHLARYGEMDIALDTFPYNGTTTSCEALWMGVPVLTFTGNSHRSRVGASLLRSAGLGHLVGHHADDFIRLATGLAASYEALQEMRLQLRARLAVSRLTDAMTFTRELERLYRTLLTDARAVQTAKR